jgi:hypothetical protein
VTKVYPRNHGGEPDLFCVGGKECKRRVALRFVRLGSAHDRVLPQVIGHPDAVETSLLGGLSYVREVSTEALWSAGPVEAV